MFFEQYWGGPTTYSEQRGHPRLRMRHMPFQVTPDMRDRWLLHMMNAVDTLDLAPEDDDRLRDYLTRAAYSLVNSPGPDAGSASAEPAGTSWPAPARDSTFPCNDVRRAPREILAAPYPAGYS